MFFAAKNSIGRYYVCILSELLIVPTIKEVRDMKFLMSYFTLPVCANFRTSEGEESFFIFVQLGSLISKEIKSLKSKWISNI